MNRKEQIEGWDDIIQICLSIVEKCEKQIQLLENQPLKLAKGEFQKNIKSFEKVLSDAILERGKRSSLIYDEITGKSELEWAIYERQKMLSLVNQLRKQRNIPLVTEQTVLRRCEWPAVGHHDYVRKYAFYCAELAMEVSECN